MAGGTLDQLVGGNFDSDAKKIIDFRAELRGLVADFKEANDAAKRNEGFMSNAGTLEQVVKGSKALADSEGRLILSFDDLNRRLQFSASVKAQYNGSTKDVIDTEAKLIKLTKEDAVAQQAANKAMREAEAIRTQAAKTATEEAKAVTETAKQKKLEQDYTIRLTKEIERLEAARDKETAKLNKQLSAYGQLNTRYNEAAKEAKELAAQYVLLGEELEDLQRKQAGGAGAPGVNLNSQIAAKTVQMSSLATQVSAANANALKLQQSLLGIEQAVGQSQRNVGNYTSAVFSLTQVLREAPAFANSFQTGLSAIGNNLPILVEEFNKVRTATGSTGAALKIFGGALFSFSGLMPLVFTGVQILVAAMSKAGKETKSANQELSEFEKTISKIAENTAKELGSLSELIIKSQNVALSYKERGEAIDELQKKWPDQFATMSREKILTGDIADAYNRAADAIYRKAEAQAQADVITDAYTKRAKAQQELDAINSNSASNFVYATDREINALKAKVSFYDNLIAATKRSLQIDQNAQQARYFLDEEDRKRFEKNQAEQRRRALLTEEQRREEDRLRKKKPPKPTDLTDEQLKAETDLTKELFEQLKRRAQIEADIQQNTAENERKNLDERIAAYRAYTNARLQIAGYEYAAEVTVTQQKLDKIAELEKIPAERRTKEQNALLRERKILTAQLENIELAHTQAVNGIVNDGNNAFLDAQDKADKARIAQAKKTAKELEELREGVGSEEAFDRQQRAREKEKAREKEAFDSYAAAAVTSAKAVTDIALAASERRIEALNAEIAAIQRRGEEEVLAYQQSTAFAIASETERTQKIAEIQATALAKQAQAEQKLKEEKYKQAQQEKAATIAEIIVKTALAVVNQLGAGDPYTAIPRALAAGALGAAELATAIATPIPQYEKGTGDKPHPGGLARVGEKNKPELIEEPGKAPYIVSRDMVRDFAKGTHVTPISDIIAMSRMYTVAGLVPVMPQKQDGAGWAEVRDELKGVKKAIQSQPGVQINFGGLEGIEDLARMGNGSARRLHNTRGGSRR